MGKMTGQKMKFTRRQIETLEASVALYAQIQKPLGNMRQQNEHIIAALAEEMIIKFRQKMVIDQETYQIKLQYSQALALNEILQFYYDYYQDRLYPLERSAIRNTIALIDGHIKGASS